MQYEKEKAKADNMSNQASSQQRTYSLMDKLNTRLNIFPGNEAPFEYMVAIANPTGGNVVVFIIVRGKPIVLQDESPLFPTDHLIGQINLLR